MKAPLPSCIDTALLVIGYGNSLRQDDGAGPHLVERLEEMRLRGVRTLVAHQLAPEHAETLARARTAVFVDAAADAPASVRLQRLQPAASSRVLAHAAEPQTLLALARDLYGHAPQSWLLALPIARTDYGMELSPTARRGIDAATRVLVRVARRVR